MDMLRCLETFCSVVESGSFTAAAEKRYLTQPSVSTHIGDLEKHYGTTLLHRRRGGVTPTDTGKLLYRYAKELLRLAKQTEDAIDDVNQLVRGAVTIGASSVPGTYIIPSCLSLFKHKYPRIHLSMKVSDTSMVINQVYGSSVDFGIVGERAKKPGLTFTRLTNDRIILAAPQDYKKASMTLGELTSTPLIMREQSSGTRMAVMEQLKKKGIGEKDLHVIMELGSTEAVKQGIIASLGTGFVSERSIKHEMGHGLLKKVTIKGTSIDRYFWVIKRSAGDLSRAAQALYEFIKKECP